MPTKFFYILVMFFFVGCASYKSYEMNISKPAHQHVKKKDLKGLVIAAEDYSSTEKSIQYFNRDLRSYGYLPVYLSFSNDSDYEFTVRTKNITFAYEDGTETQIVDQKEIIDNTKNSYARSVLGLPLFIFPAFIIGSSVSSANYELEKDYNEKSLSDFNIVKGEKIFGFVFFKIPQGKRDASLEDAILKISVVKKAKQGEMAETLEGVLSLAIDKGK